MSANDTRVVEQAAAAFWRAWEIGDVLAVTSHWDWADAEATFTSARQLDRMVGEETITRFIRDLLGQHDRVVMKPTQLFPRRLGQDLGSIFALVNWRLEPAEGPPIAGMLRTSMVLRHRDGDWKICHYAEAPLAPLVELRQFYQAEAAEFQGSV